MYVLKEHEITLVTNKTRSSNHISILKYGFNKSSVVIFLNLFKRKRTSYSEHATLLLLGPSRAGGSSGLFCYRAVGINFFQANERMNEFSFTTMKPQVNLFSFIFWKKLKTLKTPLLTSFLSLQLRYAIENACKYIH